MNAPHPDPVKALTQCDKILALLEARAGQEVSLWDLYLASGSMAIHSRVADLRTRGHVITCRTENQGKKVLSYYRLTSAS